MIGTASAGNQEVLRDLGIEPLVYGDGLEQRLRTTAPSGIQAAYSTQGAEDLELLARLGVPADRTNSVGAGPAAAEFGVHTDGSAVARTQDLDWLAQAIAYGHILAPVERVFPFDQVHGAYRFLSENHPVGKVLLRAEATPLTDEERAELLG